MRRLWLLGCATAIGCSGDPAPRLITGGGIGDGGIDGRLNVYVIDDDDARLASTRPGWRSRRSRPATSRPCRSISARRRPRYRRPRRSSASMPATTK